jgi:hypothetical protein
VQHGGDGPELGDQAEVVVGGAAVEEREMATTFSPGWSDAANGVRSKRRGDLASVFSVAMLAKVGSASGAKFTFSTRLPFR